MVVGFVLGLIVGFVLGLIVGFVLGLIVGFVLGLIVGFVLGLIVGFVLGLIVGFVLGLIVGFVLGLIVGFVLGLIVGFVLGLIVGFVLGLIVGTKETPVRPLSSDRANAEKMKLHRSRTRYLHRSHGIFSTIQAPSFSFKRMTVLVNAPLYLSSLSFSNLLHFHSHDSDNFFILYNVPRCLGQARFTYFPQILKS